MYIRYWYVSFYRQVVKTINVCLSDQDDILLNLVFSNLGYVVNEGKGSCLLEFRSISSAVETVPCEFYVLRCHSGTLCRRAKIRKIHVVQIRIWPWTRRRIHTHIQVTGMNC